METDRPSLSATKREARTLIGGGRPAHLPRGWYVQPTVFADVDNQSVIARVEIVGPVLSIIRHGSDDDAVGIANHSEYGLSGTVWSTDRERALAVARRVASRLAPWASKATCQT